MAIYQLLFRNWKLALLWALGVSASVGAFFADGGRHEQLEADVEKIREQRSHAAPAAAAEAAPAPASVPQQAGAPPVTDAVEGGEEGVEDDDGGWGQPPA